MKAFAIFAVLLVAVAAEEPERFCFKKVSTACDSSTDKVQGEVTCNAKYGAIEHLLGDLQKFANTHIHRSFEYLMMSTHYANYKMNRAGFEKIFRALSDDKWNKAIEIIQHITKRGGAMDFANSEASGEPKTYEHYEYESMAQALDMEKRLANFTNKLHREASGRNNEFHDPEISNYLEEEFAEEQAGLIRKLSGYTNDLDGLLRTNDRSIALYLFDEYLAKQ